MNIKLYASKLTNSPLCSFCKHENETTLPIFHSCNSSRRLWSQLKFISGAKIDIPYLLSQTVIFGFLDKPNNQNFVLSNNLLLLFKLNVYNSRNDTVLHLNKLG